MNRVGSQIPAKWRSFGTQLELTGSQLNSIDADQRGKSQECFSAVFNHWSTCLSPPYSWETVVKVLRSSEVNEQGIAMSIEKWLEEQVAAATQNQSIEEHVRILL